MKTANRLSFALALLTAATLPVSAFAAADNTELFEKNARPLFVEKCQPCHNEKLRSGGIDFSTTEGIRQAAATGVFGSASDPDKSPILQALGYEARVKMPPQGKLPAERIAAIREWITSGAAVPAAPAASATSAAESSTGLRPVAIRGVITDADKNFWAFKPIARPNPPVVDKKDWNANAIDRFVLANMEKNGLQPAPPASKLVLIRRATFDLTGLPPTQKEINDFLADKSPNAFEKVVDRLLASPRYGERWGRQWLDVMRYADSTGSDEDHRYPHAWRYRDYVVKAFNDDMPYNQFVREQLAGDILAAQPNSGVGYEGVVATGFLALGKKALAQKDLPLKRYDVVDDQIDVTAKALLGLTVTCARCHDHKFDPIATKDYYAMAAIFASTLSYEKGENGDPVQTPLAPEGRFEEFRKSWSTYLDVERNIAKIVDFDKEAKKDRDKQETQIAANMLNPTGKWASYLSDKARPELAKWRAATDANRKQVAAEYQEEFRRSAYQYDQNLSWWNTARNAYPAAGKVAGPRPEVDRKQDPFFYATWIDPKGPIYKSQEEQIAALNPEQQTAVRKLLDQRTELEKTLPTKEIPMAQAVKEGPTMDQKVFLRGDYHNLGDPVERTVPAILRISAPAPAVTTASGRLELADWIVDPRNPLPARVMANRIWQGHFGDGIVRTPDNFGKLGDRPSNPELLDYLATQFVEGGWSVKKLQRLIMLSKTYQMSAEYDLETKTKDPEDRFLSHFPRQRLSIEEIRDAFLYIGGNIDFTMGGTLDPGVGTDGETSASRISMNPESTNRRSLYLPLRRSNLPTLYMLFDFGDATSPEGHRNPTTVATQALFVMNSPLVEREAKALADRILKQNKKDTARLDEAYLAVLDRHADAGEIDKGLTYIQSLRRKSNDIDDARAWQSFCHALMASNEFMYIY